MTDTPKPENADQVLEVVKCAAGEKSPLEIRSGGTKQGLGRSMDDVQVLDLSALKGITYYEVVLELSLNGGTMLLITFNASGGPPIRSCRLAISLFVKFPGGPNIVGPT